MRRVVSLFLPSWPTDRLRRKLGSDAPSAETPIALTGRQGRREVVVASDRAARRVGITPGMMATQARALFSDLHLQKADPRGDAAALELLGLWALRRYSPIVAPDSPDGLRIDVTGVGHLFGDEANLAADLAGRLADTGISARVVVAPTYGAAYGLARYCGEPTLVIGEEALGEQLRPLPIAALRLPETTVLGLRDLGFETVGELGAAARAPITLRFGPEVCRRLDQAYGRAAEAIDPLTAPELLHVRRAFAEPISADDTLTRHMAVLVDQLCPILEAKGVGARCLDLLFYRVDGRIEAARVGFAKPCREAKHMVRLLTGKLDRINPGFGVEAMVLSAPVTAPMPLKQTAALDEEPEPDLSGLIDSLGNRLGRGKLYRVVALESDVPERSVGRAAPLATAAPTHWPDAWPHPVRLLARPEPVETIALLPDHPPVSFTWRGVRRRVARADGPARIFGEWWKHDAEEGAVRDYFQVEDESGERFWLYREGDGEHLETGAQRWFLHGVFG